MSDPEAKRAKRGLAFYSAALIVALVLYTVTYLLLAEPDKPLIPGRIRRPTRTVPADPFYFTNRSVNQFCLYFFAPIHWLDRRLRPQTWTYEMPI